jgi:hypothetical protein
VGAPSGSGCMVYKMRPSFWMVPTEGRDRINVKVQICPCSATGAESKGAAQ